MNFVEVDIEDSPDLTLQSGIAGTPTVQVFLGEVRGHRPPSSDTRRFLMIDETR